MKSKKFLTTLFAVLLIIGVVFAGMSASEAMIAISGKTVSLNESELSDFEDEAMIEGQIYYVYDCIATEEVTTTRYGVKTTSETNFYLIESYNLDWFYDSTTTYEPLTLVYATSDEDQIETLDEMIDDWYDFEDAYYEWYYDDEATDEDFPAYPSQQLDISGIITEYDDDKLIEYRDEYIESMGYTDSDLEDYLEAYCTDMIIKDADPTTSRNVFFVGIAVAVIGLVGLVLTLVLMKNKKTDDTIDTVDSNDSNIG
ncbi:MAG: hypothetical protein LUD57_00245 [Ruminococcus sp.]|nr:hypothetical protein [Ruminococcus sp.]